MVVAGILSGIWNGFIAAAISVINQFIVYSGSALGTAIDALPSMPDLPSPPSQLVNVEGWIAWVFPVDAIYQALQFTAAMWLIWWVISIVLRWARATRGNA